MKMKCFQKGYPELFIAVEYQLCSLNAPFIYKNQMFLPRVSKVTYCALCEFFLKKCLQLLEKQSFTLKIKIIINEYFDVCFNDEKFKRVSLG